jgi:hypothetical protein
MLERWSKTIRTGEFNMEEIRTTKQNKHSDKLILKIDKEGGIAELGRYGEYFRLIANKDGTLSIKKIV